MNQLIGYVLRAATAADIPQIADLINTAYIREIGESETTPEALNRRFSSLLESNDVQVVIDSQDRIVGFIAAQIDKNPSSQHSIWFRAHPDSLDLGIEQLLLNWSNQRIHYDMGQVQAYREVKTQITAAATHLVPILQDYGYVINRHWLEMVITLDQKRATPLLPKGITIRAYNGDSELRAMVETKHAAFRDHWGSVEDPVDETIARWKNWRTYPEYDPELWVVVVAEDQLIGIALCDTHTAYDPDMGWVSTLGIRPEWRGMGIGLALLHHIFYVFHQRGQQRAGLMVDSQSLTGATRLYERAGMAVKHQFDTYQKIFRTEKHSQSAHIV